MRLNDLQKNLYIFFSVIVSILIVTLLWENINLPLNNTIGAKGLLVSKGYNPTNDTIRYVIFISIPLIVFLYSSYIFKNKFINIKQLIEEREKSISNNYQIYILISFIFSIFIFLEFFSLNFSFSSYVLDQFHDGNYLTPFQNYLSTKKIWISSHVTHGASDIFYPVLMSKILGIQSIGAVRVFDIFLILLLKISTIILSYQLTKITNLSKEGKILFFIIFTSILLSMSRYTFLASAYYFSHKDIYIILFLILFIELFLNSNLKNFSLIVLPVIATISILFHIDIGIYINFILFFYTLYLILAKKYNDILLLFSSFFVVLSFTIIFIGLDEIIAFLNNTKSIVSSMDLMHGLKYPEPFFSLGTNQDGARATRGLLLQLTAGIFVLNYLITNNDKKFNTKKVFFLFIFLLSFVMYKNALGRSDASHIRMSNDLPILINSFFILNYLISLIEKINFKNNKIYKKFFIFLPFVIIFFYYIINQNHYNYNNIKNFKNGFKNYVNLEDGIYLDDKTKNLIKYYKKITLNENCVENISFDDAIPYLLKKPSCTKYWASWLASSTKNQKDYILELKKIMPKYILYESLSLKNKGNRKFDGLGVYERIELVNSFVLSNYQKHSEIEGYIILQKK
jgi:hypothetical protein